MSKLALKGAVVLMLAASLGCSAFNSPASTATATPLVSTKPLPQATESSFKPDDSWLNPMSLYIGDFQSGWFCNSGDGSANLYSTYDTMSIEMIHGGTSLESVSVSRQGFKLIQGHHYIITFSASTDMDRSITLRVMDPNDGTIYHDQTIELTSTSQSYRIDFTYTGEDTYDAMVALFTGGSGTNYHTITINGLCLIDLNGDQPSVKIDQLGYTPTATKRAIFSYNEGDFFNVVDVSSGQVVYRGSIIEQGYDMQSGDTVYYGDFSDLTTAGTYRIETQIGGTSYPFTIGENPYDALEKGLLYVMYLQRCGTEVVSTIDGYSHAICHDDLARLDRDGSTIDVTGGWHDAGDYGRYVNTGAKATLDLLLAYSIHPELFNDDTTIAESGNGIPDILDEARYELEWILKMQKSDGSFYSKVATEVFADFISAQDDTDPLIILGEGRTDIAAYASAVLAYASSIYEPFDSAFASKLWQAAQTGYSYVSRVSGQYIIDETPQGYDMGNYNDTDDRDQRFLLETVMFMVGHDYAHLQNALRYLSMEDLDLSDAGWRNCGMYGLYFLALQADQLDDGQTSMIHDRINRAIGSIASYIASSGYNYSNEGYGWGSNGDVANDALIMALVYDLTDSNMVQTIGMAAIHYLLGQNSLNTCFVIGYGTDSPTTLHHRMAISHDNARYIGALVGGPDAYCEDEIALAYCDTTFPAKAYYDDPDSYSTNEMAIYWNSSLLAALSILTN